jgi:RimJ/RimL family protein N-acetyltransferase
MGQVEIGYGFNPEVWGQGYATELVGAFTEWLLAQAEVRQVTAECVNANDGSRRVLEKCGFRHTGERIDPDDGILLQFARP